MPIKAQISEEIKKLESLIKTARNMTLKGTIADISAIKNNVAKLCDLTKSYDSQKTLVTPIEKLIENLDFLAIDLTKTFGWLGGESVEDYDKE